MPGLPERSATFAHSARLLRCAGACSLNPTSSVMSRLRLQLQDLPVALAQLLGNELVRCFGCGSRVIERLDQLMAIGANPPIADGLDIVLYPYAPELAGIALGAKEDSPSRYARLFNYIRFRHGVRFDTPLG